MNEQLQRYRVEVADLHAPAPELLQMLHRRDLIEGLEPTLTPVERRLLSQADAVLRRHADELAAVLGTHSPPPGATGWWWRLGQDTRPERVRLDARR